MYLVDTNILSATAPTMKVPLAELVDWLDEASESLFLSAVTAAEIHDGIAKLERQGSARKAAILSEWWAAVEHLYGDRILPFDLTAARFAGALMERARGRGFTPGFADIAIAATGKAHGLTVLTRNVRDFEPLGVALLDPCDALPVLSIGGG